MATSDRVIELGAPILGSAEKAALCDVVDSGWLAAGERVRRFEVAFAACHGADDAIAVSSATAALQIALETFDIGAGDEVLLPSMTFVAAANVVLHCGATPVFVDIEAPSRPHLSPADAEGKVTARTRAIMLMHYGGYVMDTAAWRRIADRHHAVLIEDAAHAAGLRGTGSFSDAACFSFFSNKNMTTGEGGMLIVRDAARRARARRLRSHGMTSSTLDRARGRAIGYDVVDCGHNFRMDELRAALGLVQLERLPEWNGTRRRLTQAYRAALARCDAGVDLPFAADHETAAHILPVLLPESASRDEVAARMRDAGIQTSMHYPPIHSFSYFREKVPTPPLPFTDAFAAREMTIPLHPALTIDDVDYVAKSLARALHP